ncbi:IQ domain-containing protein-containing RasGAP [Ephemerocybe angulata]|uniref:IQ domain-containing protein-containing RasGAP n=1 Tax=Ephemerocybe angulata TaxID=980116 RepID=A0A8H6IF10_9AGAR|nr:IQ domain-containing protein-containing RasGAP [Tulosesus angulatus]
MELPNSMSSNTPSGSRPLSTGQFAYQTRLLERTSSINRASTLSRNSSVSTGSLLSNNTGSSSNSPPAPARRWTPGHRVGNSLDMIRGKWEERSRDAPDGEGEVASPSPTKELFRERSMTVTTPSTPSATASGSGINAVRGKWEERTREAALEAHSPTRDSYTHKSASSVSNTGSSTTSSSSSTSDHTPSRARALSDMQRTPTYLKRHTMPAPIIASPLSPNSTGIVVEVDSPTSATPTRIHLPSSSRSRDLGTSSFGSRVHDFNLAPSSPLRPTHPSSPLSFHDRSPNRDHPGAVAQPQAAPTPLRRRPTSAHGMYTSSSSSSDRTSSSISSLNTSLFGSRSKKTDSYHNTLGSAVPRSRLGQHLPRIASGDLQSSFSDQGLVGAAMPDSSAVVGLPGRLSLKAPTSNNPKPSSRLLGSTWADKQRHLIQAYEYLCHVGEAQQWIEGCLGEELGFGVVEMEEGLRNGVVLAKLVRAFEGEQAVRRIYQAPKLDFRHSDNINIFFNFVQKEGLPEGFIFELTDLYDKKNLPKVIYCIHALSHLLSRRGRAERIGNLLGRLEFSDDQLAATQKGLKDAWYRHAKLRQCGPRVSEGDQRGARGGRWKQKEERKRQLLNLPDNMLNHPIIKSRLVAGQFYSGRSQSALQARIKLSERHVAKIQTQCFGALIRRKLKARRQVQSQLGPWATALQACRPRWNAQVRRIKACAPQVVKLQAQIRGVLQRRHYARLRTALQKMKVSFTKLQAVARAHVTRHERAELTKTFYKPQVSFSIVGLQAKARGNLLRLKLKKLRKSLKRREHSFCRGILLRRRMRAQMAKLENATDVVINIQAAVRTYLARKRLLSLIRGLRKATPFSCRDSSTGTGQPCSGQEHKSLNKALMQVHTTTSVHSLQALARASLVTPDVVNVQAAGRGYLVRQDYRAWRDHLHRSHPVATFLQALLRGVMQRNAFQAKLDYFQANLSKVVKIQSLFRAKETREQYRQLTLGKNVSVGTIKNFVHLLDDSEADFQEEIKVERLRKKVVESIRENQGLETEVDSLDIKIALVVQNAKNFEDLVKAKKKHGADNAAAQAARVSLLAAHGDPFSGSHIVDHDTRRKLELYQQLFYLLQSKADYFSRLFVRVSSDSVPEAKRQFVERVVLTVFGYGQDHREDYLLLKLFQLAIRDQISAASTPEDVMNGHPMYINIAFPYLRPKQATYARDVFQTIIRDIIDADDLDLEVNPKTIHRARIDLEEMRTGVASRQPKDVTFREAIEDLETRPIYIRHLQTLRWWVEQFMALITQSTKKVPYGIRYLARETLIWLRAKFPDAPEEMYAQCIGRFIYNKYINPVILIPETFDVVSKTVDVRSRKNLARISEVLSQIASGAPFDDDSPNYVPLNEYVNKAIGEMSAWFLEVANVPDPETQYHAHEFLDITAQPKPIYISPNEIYSLHTLLIQHQNHLAGADDILRVILAELGGVPHLDNEELKDARDTAITLELTNRFANVQDPLAEEKTMWVQAKRGVLAVLRVQPTADLLESLLKPVTENDELIWEDILEAEMESEMKQPPGRRQPSAAAPDSAYRLEDIRSWNFAAVKRLAISNLLELEKQGKISRNDGFQGILNAIAGDVRSKHRKRIQRQQEMESMSEALRQLADRKKYFLEQIDSYNKYVESAMSTMQKGKGKKRFVIPFTKQYFHLRELQRSGQTPQFGSFIYTAKYLYEKGILLSIDQYSPRQFDKLQITMSSNTAGVFTVVLASTMLGGVTKKIAKEDIRMEDLLQAKYENRPSLSILGGKVKVNFELFLYQVNKKFYS